MSMTWTCCRTIQVVMRNLGLSVEDLMGRFAWQQCGISDAAAAISFTILSREPDFGNYAFNAKIEDLSLNHKKIFKRLECTRVINLKISFQSRYVLYAHLSLFS